MATTLKDVAKRAQASEMTVSRVLRNSGYASKAMRARVIDAASALGYVPNRIAGALASQRTNLVGVVVPSITNNVYAKVLAGIVAGLEASSLQPVFGITNYEPKTEERLIRDMISWRPSGLAIAGLGHTAAARRLLAAARFPVVEMMDVDGVAIGFNVGLPQREAGAAMARHLLARGYRSIGYIAHDHRRDVSARKRHEGFVAALAEAGHEIRRSLVGREGSSQALGREMTARLLADGSRLDALYFANDDMAVGGLMHCLTQGIAVPESLAICGYSGAALDLALPQRLTTILSPRFEIGERAARHIVAQAGSQAPFRRQREVIPVVLIEGDTT